MVRSRRFALSLVCIVLLTSAVVPVRGDNTYWQHDPSSPGDWFVPGNWTAGLPESGDYACIKNGGTADFASGQAEAKWVGIGYGYDDDNTGTLTHIGGHLLVQESFTLGRDGGEGTYFLSGSGQLTTGATKVGSKGTGLFSQTGGTHTVGSLEIGGTGSSGTGTYNLSGTGHLAGTAVMIGRTGTGLFQQTGGTAELGSLDVQGWSDRSSAFELSAGQLSVDKLTIGDLYATTGTGRFIQTGGTNLVGTELLIRGCDYSGGDHIYELRGGQLTTPTLTVGANTYWGTFQQSGGTNTVDDMTIGTKYSRSRYEFTGGTLQVNSSLVLKKGEFDFLGSDVTVNVADGGFVDLSGGSVLDSGNASLLVGANSFTIVAPGFDPYTAFGTFQTEGLVQVSGQPIHITQGQTVQFSGDINSYVICEGTLTATEGKSIQLDDGLKVYSNGQVDLGSGELTVKDEISGISSGSISLDEMWVGESDVAGTFTQDGGTVVGGGLFIGYDHNQQGTYVLRGTGELTAGVEWIGMYSNCIGSFVQEGGINNAESIYLSYYDSSQAAYEMSGGQLNATYLWVADGSGTGTFTQTDGLVTVNESILLGISGGSGTYTLIHGDVLAGSERIGPAGRFCQSGGTNTVGYLHILSGGRYEYTDGTLNIGAWDIQGELDFTGTTTTIHIAEGGILDFRRLASGSIYNSEEVSLAGVPNSLIIKEEGFDPETLFKSFTTTGLVHTVGETLVIPAGVNLIFSGVHSNESAEFEDHLQCSGSLVIPGGDPYKGLDLMDGLEIMGGGHVDLGNGHVLVNDIVSGITSGSLISRNYASLRVGVSADGKFTQTGGSVNIHGVSLGSDDASGVYELREGELTTICIKVGLYGRGDFIQTGGKVVVGEKMYIAYHSGVLSDSPICTYQMSGNSELSAGDVNVGYLGKAKFIQDGGTFDASSLRVGCDNSPAATYELVDGLLKVDNEIILNGLMNQTGGTNSVSETLAVEARYNLHNGELHAQNQLVETGKICQYGGTNTVSDMLALGYSGSTNGTYELSGTGYLSADVEKIGFYGSALFKQSGGTNSVRHLVIGANGRYEWTGGTLIITGGMKNDGQFDFAGTGNTLAIENAIVDISEGSFVNAGNAALTLGEGSLLIIPEEYNPADVFGSYNNAGLTHVAGTDLTIPVGKTVAGSGTINDPVLCQGTVAVTPGNELNLSGGLELSSGGRTDILFGGSSGYTTGLTTTDLNVGSDGTGTLNLQNTDANLVVSNRLKFGPGAALSSVDGSAIHMTGSAFENTSTDPAALADMINLTLIFEGGTTDIDPFEAAGEDMGPVMEGYDDNFALGTLQLGGDDIGQLQLVNLFDNRPGWEGSEALYVEKLILGAGSTLDLNGLNLYYLNGTFDGAITDSVGNGGVHQVPEPATLALLGFGGLGVLFRRRRRQAVQ